MVEDLPADKTLKQKRIVEEGSDVSIPEDRGTSVVNKHGRCPAVIRPHLEGQY